MFQLVKIIPLLLLLVHFQSRSTSYYVNDNSLTGDVYTSVIGNNGNSGLSPSTPKATLSNLLSTYSGTFSPGDEIYIDAGTYFTTDANLNLGAGLNGISIIGAGSSLTFFDNDGTSIDANRWANITGSNITIQGIYLTGYNFGTSGASTLNISGASNLNIIDVQVNENNSGGGSSAIVINGGSSVNFTGGGSSCNPTGPSVAGGGANIEGNGNVVSFTNYSLTGNSKDLQGGSGLYISGDNTTFVTITNSTISNNVNTSGEGGAGIYISGSNLTLSGCCISGNSTNSGSGPKYGGGITLARGATVTATNCSFSNNAVSNSGKGGAISINTSYSGSGGAASVTLNTCSFNDNTTDDEGHHIYLRVGSLNPASVSITECSFSTTTESIRQDNSGTVTIQNSGNPTMSGTGFTVNNTTPPSSSPATFCPSAAVPCFSFLPIELIEFSANCSDASIEIKWTTATERNNDYFILEKMDYSGSFQEIAKINGNGQSQSILHYSFTDASSSIDKSYYRLKQVDFDGKSETFEMIASPSCHKTNETLVNFDRVRSTLILFIPPSEVDKLQAIEVLSVLGNDIKFDWTKSPNPSSQILKFTHTLSSGSYMVRLIYSDHEERTKFLSF